MNKLEINLFGVFEARADGIPIRLPTRRVELILALLAVDVDRAISRSHLSSLIWPGQAEPQARASLRQAIFRLRSALGPSYSEAMDVTTGWLKLRRDKVVLDIDGLEPLSNLSKAPSGLPLDGLSGFEPEIEDLLHARRAELRQRLVVWLEQAERQCTEARQFADLERLARLHISLDGYDEGALRMLMTALSRQGRRNAALDAFHETSKRIRTDLSVAVEPPTLELFNEIRTSVQSPAPVLSRPDRLDEESSPVERRPDLSMADAELSEPAHLRHLVVMHVISERLAVALREPDPESAEAQSRMALWGIEEAVKREGGKIVGRAGHHVSCVFGAGRPDENPALSAALAAYEISRLNSAVALHAGRALIGSGTEVLPLAHVAQGIAEDTPTGTVRLTAPVELECRGAFEMEEMPSYRIDTAAFETWRLSGEARSRGGFDIRKARGLTRFAGRSVEMQTLADALTTDGPRAVFVIGDAGIGKSRLIYEFLTKSGPKTALRVQFTKGETGGGVDRFADPLETLGGGDVAPEVQDLLDVFASAVGDAALAKRMMPPLAALLGQSDMAQPWFEASRSHKYQWLADALLIAMGAVCGRDAVLLVEDAHWADDDAQLLLDRLSRSLDSAGPMLVVTQRPGVAETWTGYGHISAIRLRPLDDNGAEALLSSFALPVETAMAVLQRGAGNPLFLEELARLGSDDVAEAPGEVPITLTSMLSHRLDALSPGARRLIEAAAVIGTEPSDTLLITLCGLRQEAYEAAVSALADADLLYRIRSVPERIYGFKHALVQDAAYHSIPTTRRQALHAAIVERSEPDWRKGDKTHAALLAGHAESAGLARKAVDFAFAAAEDAIAASSHALADRMLDTARRSIAALEGGPETKRLELRRLQLRLPVLVAFAKTEELQADLAKALALAQELGDDCLFAFLSLHAAFVFQHYDPANALIHAEAARGIAASLEDASLLRASAISRCQILSFQGKMSAALTAIKDHALSWEDSRAERDEYLVSRFVMNQFLLTRSFAAIGDTARALQTAEQAADAAMENDHPIDRYIALLALGDLFAFADRNDEAASAFRSAKDIAIRQKHTFFELFAAVQLGKAELFTDAAACGFERLRKLSDMGDAGLEPVLRLEAEAALACHQVCRGDPNLDPKTLEELLRTAEAMDLPIVQVSLLRALAELKENPERDFLGEADAIVAEQGYAKPELPDGLTVASFMTPVTDIG